ncbi:protein translocase subunit SecD [Streptomyces sp. NPDC059985]|uniref:protein translocase subunit SecD n=1 Tax=Streptomyces sp. NPDC059985 TaxID=3347025 RepID=UPI0036A09A5E
MAVFKKRHREGRPVTALAVIIASMAALVAAMFGSGHHAPRLGIDLAGGTSITLTAHSKDPAAINKANMETAVAILQKRVNGMGVSEAEVQTQGKNNIIVNIPKGAGEQQAVQQVGQTAKLYFRPTLAIAMPTAPAAAGKPAPAQTTGVVPKELTKQFDALDCAVPAQRTNHQQDDGKPAVACAQNPVDGLYPKYALGPVAVDGATISKANPALEQNGAWSVQLKFDGKGTEAFAATTSRLASQQEPGNQFAIVIDGQVISSPRVNGPITAGMASITGNFTPEEAKELANVLNYGALPLSFTQSDVTTVSPQLGSKQLDAGLTAGAIGLALVVAFSLLYYRGLGIVSVASLAVSGVLTYATMTLLGAGIGFALNLPAVCGAIVAIGITADSFVVYFERIRDQIRDGTTLRIAAQRAWPKARRTILVSDFVSFLAAAVLYVVTVGKVQGFAFTLGLTTLLDVVVIYLFTKPVITLLARTRLFASGHPITGLDPRRLGAGVALHRAAGHRRTTEKA